MATLFRRKPFVIRTPLILFCAILPIVLFGWLLLKSSEDAIIAEQVSIKEQEKELVSYQVNEVELQLLTTWNEFLKISENPNWYQTFREDPRIGGVRWASYYRFPNHLAVELKTRSAEVSQWLLSPEENQPKIKLWLENARSEYAPSFILFVLLESGLSSEFPILELQLQWELDPNDTRGIPLQHTISILWDEGNLPTLGEKFEWQKQEYTLPVNGVGEDFGIVRVTSTTPNRLVYRNVLLLGCFIWIIVLFFFLFLDARKKERLAQESLDQLSTVAHELRTPLTGMKLLVEHIKNQHSEISQLDQIEDERYRLEGIVEQFLVQGKLKKSRLRLTSVDWQTWLTNEYQRYQRLSTGSIDLECNTLHRSKVFLDPSLMSLVLLNLLKNAEQYGEGKLIVLKETVTKGSVAFSVIDQGIGMDSKMQKKIFQRYERGEMALSRNTEGLGLGLNLVKDIVTLHDGQIDIWSKVGTGTEVRVTLSIT